MGGIPSVGMNPSGEAVHEHHAADTSGHEGSEHAHHSAHAGHAGHGDHVAQFRTLFWIMLILSVPVVGANMMFADLVGYTLPDNPAVEWIRRCSALSCSCGAAGRS